jgi:hypothetical protein
MVIDFSRLDLFVKSIVSFLLIFFRLDDFLSFPKKESGFLQLLYCQITDEE